MGQAKLRDGLVTSYTSFLRAMCRCGIRNDGDIEILQDAAADILQAAADYPIDTQPLVDLLIEAFVARDGEEDGIELGKILCERGVVQGKANECVLIACLPYLVGRSPVLCVQDVVGTLDVRIAPGALISASGVTNVLALVASKFASSREHIDETTAEQFGDVVRAIRECISSGLDVLKVLVLDSQLPSSRGKNPIREAYCEIVEHSLDDLEESHVTDTPGSYRELLQNVSQLLWRIGAPRELLDRYAALQANFQSQRQLFEYTTAVAPVWE